MQITTKTNDIYTQQNIEYIKYVKAKLEALT